MGPTSEKSAYFSLACVLFILLLAGVAEACSVPVYRWALERWEAERYTLKAPGVVEANKLANVNVEPGEGGRFELLYPPEAMVNAPVLTGGVGELNAEALVDSPVRKELVRRLLGGQSAVWLLLKCGDAGKDAAAAKTLSEQIELANRTLKLPDLTGDPVLDAPDAPDVSGLRVEFSVIEVARDDPSESVLVKMLLGSERDLAEAAEPLAFPVFGRGRVLYALVGAGINPGMVMKACAFVVGPCACEIKADNPGFDLLLTADWESGAGAATLIGKVDELPPLPGTALNVVAVAPEHAQLELGATAESGGTASGLLRSAAVAALVLGLVVIAASAVMLRRRKTMGS